MVKLFYLIWVVVLFFSLKRPLYLFLLIIAVRFGNLGGILIHGVWPQITLLSGFLVTLLFLVNPGKERPEKHTTQLGFIMFFYIVVISAFLFSKWVYDPVPLRRMMNATGLFIISIYFIKTKKDLNSIFNTLVILGTFNALFEIQEYMTGVFHTGIPLRASGLFGSPNALSVELVTLIPLAFFLLNASKRTLMRIFYFLCICLIIIGIVLTNSRGGFMTFFFMGVLLTARYYKNKTFRITGLLIILLAVIFTPSFYIDRVLSIQTLGKENPIGPHYSGSVAARKRLYIRALYVFRDNFLFGVGPGNFRRKAHKYRLDLGYPYRGPTHNMYLTAATETGILGLLTFLSIVVTNLAIIWKIHKASYWQDDPFFQHFPYLMFVSLASAAFGAMSFSNNFDPQVWFLLSVPSIVQNIIKNEGTQNAVDNQRPATLKTVYSISK